MLIRKGLSFVLRFWSLVICIMAGASQLHGGDRRTYVPGNFDYKEPTITVEKLDRDTAKELARFKGNLRLWGLRTMTPEVARAFAETKTGEDLDLSGLTDLSVEVAEILAPTDAIAVWLGLRTMNANLARALVPVRGYLIFPDLETLTPEAARELARDDRGISILGPLKLTPETARALTDRKPRLVGAGVHLKGIKALDGPDAVAIAEALASTPGVVYLQLLERVSARALAVLRTKPSIHLPPDEKLTIVPE